MPKEVKRISFEIEHYDGNTYMGFMLSIKDDGSVDIVKTYDCSNADACWDYVFDTENELYRIQADRPIAKREFEDIWDCYNERN